MTAAAGTVVEYEPRGAALELFRTRTSEVVLAGPAGTGKSLACLFRVHLVALANPGIRCLIVRKFAVSLGSTTLVTFEKRVAADALAARLVTWFGGSTREAACYRYSNGSTVVVGGLDKPEKILSSEYDLVFVDEATELTVTDWETIGTRLRNGKLAWQQQIGACNPGAPTHWLKQRADRGDLTMLASRHRDNPAYVNQDGTYTEAGQAYIVGKLGKLTGVRKLRLGSGLWAAAEGLVYEDFDEAVHVIGALPKGSETWTRWWTIDFGYSNPFVCQFWAQDGDGRLYRYREIYKTKTLVEDHAKKILRLVRRCAECCKSKSADHDCHDCKACRLEWTEPRPRKIVCDHDAEDRATLERHLGMSTEPARKTVSEGVQQVQSRLKVQPDGKPRLFLVKDALVEVDKELDQAEKPTCTDEEITGYVWPDGDKNPDKREHPVKVDDHGMDAMRYMVAEADLGRRPRYRSFTY